MIRALRVDRLVSLLVTVGVFVLILRRIPFEKLVAALGQADYPRFLALMIPNTIFYFCWDTLVLMFVIRWFHGPVAWRHLLPVRAASYVVGFFNTNVGRGALAAYLSRRLHAPFLQLGSTVLFLVLTEYMHLVAWATLGIIAFGSDRTRGLRWVPPAVALLWLIVLLYTRGLRSAAPETTGEAGVGWWLRAPREWGLLRTFRIAPPSRYIHVVLLRAPMFFVSLCLHYLAARTFGIEIPFGEMLMFLPVIFMVAALPITVAHLGTTQAAWILFFEHAAPAPQLLAFSLAAHLTFSSTRALLGLMFLPRAYADLIGRQAHETVPRPTPARP